ncbi:MAG: hypothetical protein IH797_06690, partial [Chloroflexi bacterium]|nr:hypothetical protein [Chloroflexota bacterium]
MPCTSISTTSPSCSVAGTPEVTLRLDGPTWSGWEPFCEDLASYLNLQAGSLSEERVATIQKQLLNTNYFEVANCKTDTSQSTLTCDLLPTAIIRDV